MPRIIWKGAISFGLVHIPVALYPAAQESGVDFDWLDKRTMDPVGYRRINKRTGHEIDKDDIVRGIQQEGGKYVLLSDEQIKSAYPRATQTIEIEAFVHAGEIGLPWFEQPYYLAPQGKSGKVYALLREALVTAGLVGVARLVMHNKQHLAVLAPSGPALMLNTIRWAAELRDPAEIEFPPAGAKAAGVKDAELKMAVALVRDMTGPWEPKNYADEFSAAIHELVRQKVKAGDTEEVQALEDAPEAATNVVDLTALLKRSLTERKGPPKGAAGAAPARKTAARKSAPKKRA